MIGPVSSTGRAMMASLQQAMAKGMPPDQAIQYVKSMAQQGIAPLADLYSMMMQFERLKKQQVQPPPAGTIRDQLNQMEQMQAQAAAQPAPHMQAPIDQGLGAINAGTMEEPQFNGGGIVAFQQGSKEPVSSGSRIPYTFNDELAARIPSFMKSDMDIISFVKAQMPNFDTLPMAQKQEVLQRFEPMYKQAREARNALVARNAPEVAAPAAPVPVDMMAATPVLSAASPFATEDEMMQEVLRQGAIRPSERVEPAVEREPAVTGQREAKPKEDQFADFRYEKPDLAAIRAEREERQKREKTGAYSQADAELAAYIKEQKEQYGASEKEARNSFWIQTGAALMASKSPYFLQALGESVKENYGGLVKDLRKLKADNNTLRLEEIKLQQAKERALESDSASDLARYETLQKRYDDRQYDIKKTELDIEQKALNRATEIALAKARTSGQTDVAAQLWAMRNDAINEKDPAAAETKTRSWEKAIADATKITEATTAGGVSSKARRDMEVAEAIAAVKKDPEYRRASRTAMSSTATAQQKADAQATMARMVAIAEADPARVLGVTVPSGYGPTTAAAAAQNPFAGFSATPIP